DAVPLQSDPVRPKIAVFQHPNTGWKLLRLGQDALVIGAAFSEKDDVGELFSQTRDVLRPLRGGTAIDEAAGPPPVRNVSGVEQHAAHFAAPALDGARQPAPEPPEGRGHDKKPPSSQIDRSL